MSWEISVDPIELRDFNSQVIYVLFLLQHKNKSSEVEGVQHKEKETQDDRLTMQCGKRQTLIFLVFFETMTKRGRSRAVGDVT